MFPKFLIDIDFETRSAVDLRSSGACRYSEDPSTEILCAKLEIRRADAPTLIYHRTYLGPTWSLFPLQQIGVDPKELLTKEQLLSLGRKEDVIWTAHNASFERALWETLGEDPPPPERWRCTAAQAAAAGLPRGLEKAALALRLPIQKDAAGRRLMLKVCKPGFPDTPDSVARMLAYCAQDVRVEAALARALPPLPLAEQAVWELDARINARGFRVDLVRAEGLQMACQEWEVQLLLEMDRLTSSQVRSPRQVAALRTWLQQQGVSLKDLRARTVSAVLEGKDEEISEGEAWDPLEDLGLEDGALSALDGPARRVLEIRQSLAKSSVAKLQAFREWATEDDRVHGAYIYWGAGTGRWAGKGPQPQNMPRPSRKHAEVLQLRDLLARRNGVAAIRAKGLDPMHVAADSIRSLIVPSPGRKLAGGDFSGIEMRVLAWLAGEKGVLELLEKGADPYVSDAAQIYGVREQDVTPEQRQIGKVARLALGYQGALGAFSSMARNYGVVLPDDVVQGIVSKWRGANGAIVAYWAAVQAAVLEAMRIPGIVSNVRQTRFICSNGTLRLILPSGRQLWYRQIQQDPEDGGLKYSSPRGVVKLYGGKFVENITQAVSRDLLAQAMLRLEAAGVEIVCHTHDEVIAEVDEIDLEEMKRLLCQLPVWAAGLPVDAKCWSGTEYQK